MRENRKNQKKDKKIKGRIYKACLIGALITGCTLTSPFQTFSNSYQMTYAATENSLSEQIPKFTLVKRSATTATLSIEQIKQASYYKIYRCTSKNGTYSYVGKTSEDTFTDKGLKSTKAYYYKIKAYHGTTESKTSKIVKLNATLGKVKNVKAVYKDSEITLKWDALKNAGKYKVYRSLSKNGAYTYIGSSSTTAFTDASVEVGRTYYYKVRAMKTISKVKYNGIYSTVSAIDCSALDSTDSNSSYIDEVLRLINIERTKEGLAKLSTTSSLKDAAYQRAVEIKDLFSHDRPDGSSCFSVLSEFNISYMAAGENIAYGQKTPKQVVESWMNSKGHKENIMNSKFGKVGIGCYYNNGTYYWTQLFTN